MQAKAQIPRLQYDSKAEADYAAHLNTLYLAGDIKDWVYAPANWRLALPGTQSWYRPDFFIIAADGTVEWHEVKGTKRQPSGKVGPYYRGDARAKVCAAAALYPWFRWIVAWKDKSRGGWQTEVL